MPLAYHPGQIEVQTEANTRPAAESLGARQGERAQKNTDFYAAADLLVCATQDDAGLLRFSALSGAAPMLEVAEGQAIGLPLRLPDLTGTRRIGAIAIDLREARRARLNGTYMPRGSGAAIETTEEFVNCRKYIAPSIALQAELHAGPAGREIVTADDEAMLAVLGGVETAFLATIGPDGAPDVSHKGGACGFLAFDAASAELRWDELIGNGMFKSAGNIRATGIAALVVLDLASGDAYEFSGHARYDVALRYDEPREKPLWQATEDFPTQGVISLSSVRISRLRGFVQPRQRLEAIDKVTSCSPVEAQVRG